MTTISDSKTNIEELEKLNELFAKRYTDQDMEYVQMSQRSFSPPVVDNWTPDNNSFRQAQFNNNNQSYRFLNNHHHYRNSSNNRKQYRYQPYRDTRRPKNFFS